MAEYSDLYLTFTSEEYYFLLPLSWVKTVRDGKESSDQLPVLNFCDLTGMKCSLSKGAYLLVLEGKGESFGILVDNILELCEVDEDRVMELKTPVINEQNAYLSAAVLISLPGEQNVMAYILEPEILYAKFKEL